MAFSADGRARSGMGVDSADYDQDGWMDLFVANIDREIYSIYQNNHDETFDDQARETGVGMATRLMSGWGLKFFDYDNDGNLDLFLANGNPDDLIESLHPGVTYKEPPILMHNTGRGFQNVSAQSGPIFSTPDLSPWHGDWRLRQRWRGGRSDRRQWRPARAAAKQGREAESLARRNGWSGKKSNPDAIGARVTYQAGDLKRSHMKVGGGSYLSSHDPRMVLGLGAAQEDRLARGEMAAAQRRGWTALPILPIDRYITIVEGQEKWK